MAQEEMFQMIQAFTAQRGEFIILNGQRIKAYNMRTITLEQFRMLIACGNDRHNNQIRVTKSGMVYLSEDIVGSEQLDDVALCFETFSAHNGYVGVKAAEDNSHVIPLYYALIGNWVDGCRPGSTSAMALFRLSIAKAAKNAALIISSNISEAPP